MEIQNGFIEKSDGNCSLAPSLLQLRAQCCCFFPTRAHQSQSKAAAFTFIPIPKDLAERTRRWTPNLEITAALIKQLWTNRFSCLSQPGLLNQLPDLIRVRKTHAKNKNAALSWNVSFVQEGSLRRSALPAVYSQWLNQTLKWKPTAPAELLSCSKALGTAWGQQALQFCSTCLAPCVKEQDLYWITEIKPRASALPALLHCTWWELLPAGQMEMGTLGHGDTMGHWGTGTHRHGDALAEAMQLTLIDSAVPLCISRNLWHPELALQLLNGANSIRCPLPDQQKMDLRLLCDWLSITHQLFLNSHSGFELWLQEKATTARGCGCKLIGSFFLFEENQFPDFKGSVPQLFPGLRLLHVAPQLMATVSTTWRHHSSCRCLCPWCAGAEPHPLPHASSESRAQTAPNTGEHW